MISGLWHLCRSAYYGVAARHLLRTDPMHPDLPWICEQKRRSDAAVDRTIADLFPPIP